MGALGKVIADLEAKVEAGVKQVRCTTILAAVREAAGSVPAAAPAPRSEALERLKADLDAERAKVGRMERDLREYRNAKPQQEVLRVKIDGSLMGVAEAAERLGVEKQRIARYVRQGVLPEPVATLQSGPVWTGEQIEAALETVEARRRPRV